MDHISSYKLECLEALWRAFASPTAYWRKIWGEKTIVGEMFFFWSPQDGMKYPEMHKKWKWENIFGGEINFWVKARANSGLNRVLQKLLGMCTASGC